MALYDKNWIILIFTQVEIWCVLVKHMLWLIMDKLYSETH